MKILPAIRILALPALAFALILASALSARARQVAAGEIVDPATGVRWVLVRDTAHPEAPGRWVLARGQEVGAAFSHPRPAVIRAGDRIVLVEHSAIADARLAAFALTSAAKGETLRARIAIGGGIVLARAAGKGVAELGPPEAGPGESGPGGSGSAALNLEARP